MNVSDIMLQGFKWDARVNGKVFQWYNHLTSKANDLEEAKIDMVWFPPPSKSKVQEWVGYTPIDYYDLGEFQQWVQEWNGHEFIWRQHNSIETLYGSHVDLKNTINTFKSKGIRCIVDIVINHRDAQQVNIYSQWVSWGGPAHKIASGKMVWGDQTGRPSGVEYWDNDRPEEITYLHGGRSLDDGDRGFGANVGHTNMKAKSDIKEWMRWLKDDIQFDGWRYDYVKGFAAYHIGDYNDHTNPYLSVGEYWDNAENIYSWINGTHIDNSKKSSAFDFPLKWHLNEIFWGWKPFHKLGLWKMGENTITGGWPEKSVTFLDNHDTTKEAGKEFPKDDKRLIQGHVFLLTHPGIPCIFWTHYYERNQFVHDKIKELCQFRKNNGITNLSNVEVIESHSCYAARINGNVIVKIGDDFWSPSGVPGNWQLKMSGDGYAIWTL